MKPPTGATAGGGGGGRRRAEGTPNGTVEVAEGRRRRSPLSPALSSATVSAVFPLKGEGSGFAVNGAGHGCDSKAAVVSPQLSDTSPPLSRAPTLFLVLVLPHSFG